jgi:hypothetical protein
VRRDLASGRQEVVRTPPDDAGRGCDGRARFPSWRCGVLDVAMVALTIVVFTVLVLVLRALERL